MLFSYALSANKAEALKYEISHVSSVFSKEPNGNKNHTFRDNINQRHENYFSLLAFQQK